MFTIIEWIYKGLWNALIIFKLPDHVSCAYSHPPSPLNDPNLDIPMKRIPYPVPYPAVDVVLCRSLRDQPAACQAGLQKGPIQALCPARTGLRGHPGALFVARAVGSLGNQGLGASTRWCVC